MVIIIGVVNRGIYSVIYPGIKKMFFAKSAFEFETGWMKFE